MQRVVQVCCNYNIVFHKLEIKVFKMRLVPVCYTSGRGASNLFGPGRCTNSTCHAAHTLNIDGVREKRIT